MRMTITAYSRAAAGKSEWLAGDHGAAARRTSAAASPSPPAARCSGVGSPSCKLAPLRSRERARAAVRVSRCASGVQPRLATSQAARSAWPLRFAISSGVPKGVAAREAP